VRRAIQLCLCVVLIGAFLISLPVYIKHSAIGGSTNQSPVAAFTYSPEIPTPEESIAFDASASYDPDGWIVTYAWDFGDGSRATLTDATITHSYPVDGSYTVELTVTDDAGMTAEASAVVQVNTEVYFRLVVVGSLIPVSGVEVTMYYKTGSTWTKAPVASDKLEIRYDNMTQPDLANTPQERFRNPGYTASILLDAASNIGFDIHPSSWSVYFKFKWGSVETYWPNDTTRVYTYKNGVVQAHDYSSYNRAYWDSTAGTYVIKAKDIPKNGVSPTQCNPIIVGILCPPPPLNCYLTVRTDPTGITSIPGEGWYPAGTNVTLTAPQYVNVSTGTRYRFSDWDVDGTSKGSGVNPIVAVMNANHTATAHYILQYLVVFGQTGVGSDFTGTVVTIDGVNYGVSNLPTTPQFWWDQGSNHGFAFASPLTVNAGKKYVWTNTTGLSSQRYGSITISSSGNVTGCYKTQYYLTVTSAYGTPGGQGWYDSDSPASATVTPLVVSGPSGTQYVFTHWSGDASGTTSPSDPITMDGPKTATANWKTQYYLTITSAYDSPTPTSGWLDAGASVNASVASPTGGPAGTQYICTGWTGTGSVPASGSYSLVTFTMNAPSSITWNWKTQYQVIFDQSGVGSDFTGTVVTIDGINYGVSNLPTTPQFWLDQGSNHNFSFVSPLAVNGGKNYVWASTTGLSSVQSGTFTITTSGNVVGNYIEQNRITFDQTGVSPDFNGTVVIIDGVNYNRSQLPVSFPWTLNSVHSFAFQSPLVVGANAEKCVWNSTTGLSNLQSGSITVTTYGSIVGCYKTQYYLTVTSAYGTPGGQGWYDSGSPASATVTPLVVSGPSGTQYVFTHWSGDASGTTSPSDPITMDGPKTATANWKTQYYLTLDTNPPGVASPSGSGWYDAGTNATVSTTAFVDIAPGSSRYRFNGWTTTNVAEIADPLRSPTNVLMDEAKTVTANYAVQYLVTFSQSGVGSDFTGTVVTVDTRDYNVTSLPANATFWWDKDSVHNFAFQSPLTVNPNTKQYVWTSTSGLTTLQSGSITVSASGSVTGNYNTQYVLTVLTNPLGLSPQPSRNPLGQAGPANGWWYDASTGVTLTAQSVPGYAFNYWDVDGTSQGNGVNPITVNMNGPHTAKANYTGSPPPLSISISPPEATILLGGSVDFTSTISGGTSPYTYQWYLDDSPVSGATSESWVFTPTSGGIYYIYLKVTDANSNTVQSETARITVFAQPPIGGYSDRISSASKNTATGIAAYVALVALFGAGLSLRKRKRK
jgi:uncharacterized repeat protein (TIGR02543 family)